MSTSNSLWWRDGVIYQIYPRSFQDSNGDGIGDLNGILTRVDYLATLGIDAVWISPFYPSPMADFGYDVADYTDVDPRFGTLEDFDRLLAALHERGLRVILDFVPNHTSDQHSWFRESRHSRRNPKRDWYIWRSPDEQGNPPNNWQSNFGGSAWTMDDCTRQFYLHSFLKEQPDLNWRNPEVRAAIYAAMRFWLDRGVDGFRMDVLWLLIKDEQLRDNPPNPGWHIGDNAAWQFASQHNANHPETHQIVREMRLLMDEYPDRLLIGEIYLPLPELIRYYGESLGDAGGNEAHLPFNFRLIETEWSAEAIATLILEYESLLPAGAWPNWVLGNHDQHRLATRIGAAQARVAALLLLTLRGTPTLYYGDELGLPDAHITPEQVQDPAEKNQPGIGAGRDPERAPMQWDAAPLAGFTTGKPWLPLAADPALCSVAAEHTDPRSMLSLYRTLLALRRKHPALHAGSITDIFSVEGVLHYQRVAGDDRLQIILNLTSETRRADFPTASVLLSSHLDRDDEVNDQGTAINLRPNEALILKLA